MTEERNPRTNALGRLTTLTVLLVLTTCSGNGSGRNPQVTVTLDPARAYQAFLLWSADLPRWDAPHMFLGAGRGPAIYEDAIPASDREAILDSIYTDLGLNGIQANASGTWNDPSVDPPDGWLGHEPHNDNDDPEIASDDPSRWDFRFFPPLAENVLAAKRRIEARGVDPVIALRFRTFEAWMLDEQGFLRPDMVAEYVEWVVVLLRYFRDVHGIEFDIVSVDNEPDSSAAPEVYAQMTSRLAEALRREGLGAALGGPETFRPDQAGSYFDALDTGHAAGDIDFVLYHNYDYDPSTPGSGPDWEARREIARFAERQGAATILNELGSEAKENRRTFWNNTREQGLAWANDFVNEMTVTAAAGFTLQLAFWSNVNANYGTDSYVRVNLDGQGRYLGWEVAAFTEMLGQFVRNVRPGMVRIEAVSSDNLVRVVAFVDEATRDLTVVAVNNDSSPRRVVVEGSGLSGTVAAKDVLAIVGKLAG